MKFKNLDDLMLRVLWVSLVINYYLMQAQTK